MSTLKSSDNSTVDQRFCGIAASETNHLKLEMGSWAMGRAGRKPQPRLLRIALQTEYADPIHSHHIYC